MRPSARRCASRGARSTSERRSRSARATAISSSTLPPEYISATTAPASGWPSASAALIDTSAIASTPSRPAQQVARRSKPPVPRSRARLQASSRDRQAPAGRRAQAASPAASPAIAIETSAHRMTRSNDIGPFRAQAARGLSPKMRRLPLREINRGPGRPPLSGDRAGVSRKKLFCRDRCRRRIRRQARQQRMQRAHASSDRRCRRRARDGSGAGTR